MKIFLTLFFICFTISAEAQFLNNSFEDWDSTCVFGSFSPVDWSIAADVTQNLDAYEGNYSVHLEVSEIFGNLESPELITNECGTFSNLQPITERFESVSGYYKYDPQSNDLLTIRVEMFASDGSTQIGFGLTSIWQQTSQWTQFDVDIIYSDPGIPSFITTRILITDFEYNIPGHLGSMADVDLLSLENLSEVETTDKIPFNYILFYNFPNPFNPSTTIKYQIPELSFVTLKVYDVLGDEIATLVEEEKPIGNYKVDFNAINLPSGIYFYRLQAGSFIETKKMVLMK